MKQLAVDVSEATEQQLKAAADRLKITPAELAAAAIRDLLAHPEPDFEEVAKRIVEKNRELYRRLA